MIYKLSENRVHRTYCGGKKIDAFTGIPAPADRMPEDWTASITSAYDSAGILEGIGTTTDGKKLPDLIGDDAYPLLVKLLDAEERLVIQAHPTASFARKYLHSNFGKTECWYFLDCAPDAYVHIGFQPDATRERWEKAFLAQDVAAMIGMLHRVPVKKGDFIFVAGGVPHAIGPGCFMIELQEPSDLMVVAERFTPSGRKIPEQRMNMGLPFNRMMDVYDYTPRSFAQLKKALMPSPVYLGNGATEILGKETTDQFRMLRLDENGAFSLSKKYAVGICISGQGKLNEMEVKRGDRMLIQAEPILNFDGSGDFSIILCC